MKRLILSVTLALFASTVAQAVVWEYAKLASVDAAFRSFIAWDSPKGDNVETLDIAKMVAELKKRKELKEDAHADSIFQLVQALGREGWEVAQEQKGDNPRDLFPSRTYLLKRQKN